MAAWVHLVQPRNVYNPPPKRLLEMVYPRNHDNQDTEQDRLVSEQSHPPGLALPPGRKYDDFLKIQRKCAKLSKSAQIKMLNYHFHIGIIRGSDVYPHPPYPYYGGERRVCGCVHRRFSDGEHYLRETAVPTSVGEGWGSRRGEGGMRPAPYYIRGGWT